MTRTESVLDSRHEKITTEGGDFDMKPGFTVVVRLDQEGGLTGDAREVIVTEADELCESAGYATYGTWEAFQADLCAQEQAIAEEG